MTCKCRKPSANPNPRAERDCVKCGRNLIEAPGIVRDKEIGEFYDLVESSNVPGFDGFRAQAAARELAGRKVFGFRYLQRDNVAEALEEAADGGNYCLFEKAVRERAGEGNALEFAFLYEAAEHFARAHAALRRYDASRKGSP